MSYSAVRAWREADACDRGGRVGQTLLSVRAGFAVSLLVVGAVIALTGGK